MSQTNLLLNGKFQDINTCKEYKAECGVEGWYYLKDIKVQSFDKEPGKDEAANSFVIFFYRKNDTGFTPVVGTILPCRLQKGKEYIFKGKLTARLHPTLLLKPGVSVGEFFYVPHRQFSKAMKPDSIVKITRVPESSFFEFEYTFMANGNERYLTFGTYIREDQSSVKKAVVTNEVSLSLQDFSLTPADPTETFCTAYTAHKQKIYSYDHRHKEMDYSLYAKGTLPVDLSENKEDNITRTIIPAPKITKPDTLKLGDVLFDFNKADLKTNAIDILSAFFKSKSDQRAIDSIFIDGHTDSVGSDTRNIQLSQQRSESVSSWLTANKVLPAERISINAFGKARPIATNRTPAGRALNRRVELIVFRREM